MVIDLESKDATELYLSIVSIGILHCLEEGLFDYDDAMSLLYQPFNIEKLEDNYSELGEAIHLGTELEDVADLLLEKVGESIRNIKKMNQKLVKKKYCHTEKEWIVLLQSIN